MPAFTTVLSIAAVAGALVQAAPLASRAKPDTYYEPYLEPYDGYHLRYLALDCQDQHNTTFFEDCCHPLLSTQKLSDRPAYCTPNATEIASASSYIASTAAAAAATPAAQSADAATPAAASPTSTKNEIVSEYSAAQASYTPSTKAAASPSTENNYAQPTTTSTQAAATTQASSSNSGGNTNSGGYATYFYQGGNAGACGTVHSDYDNIVAIDSAWWPNFGQQSQYCGRWLTVTNTNNGRSVVAQVADVCPTCANGNSLDLSVGAFTAIASEGDGMVPISWHFN